MAEAASRRLQRHCSQDVARERLAAFFEAHAAAIDYARRVSRAAAAASGDTPCARS
jgi:ADP-ribose pyrophosphatase YjhB (NUDIX family)